MKMSYMTLLKILEDTFFEDGPVKQKFFKDKSAAYPHINL